MTIQLFTTQLLEHCGVDPESIDVVVDDGDEKVHVDITVPEEDSGLCIGVRGEGLLSIQRMIRLSFMEEIGDKKCVVDINNYRAQKTERLYDLVGRVVDDVRQTGVAQTINTSLTSYERYEIHSLLAENDVYADVTSYSSGEGPSRKLTIALVEEEEV
ncbi:MAG: hypothetical protein H6774_02075 [Pseudomonadales bacterium]|nr:hypothetical protein [Pseudomonadales bacterium]